MPPERADRGHGPAGTGRGRLAREARLEVTVSGSELPEGLPLHLKVDTGMGRWGMPPEELGGCPPTAWSAS